MAEGIESPRDRLLKKTSDHTFLHIRVDRELKADLQKYAQDEHTSVTAVVTSLIENLLYKRSEEEDEDEEEQLLEVLISSLMNLEQRMEIRLGTLQDTFNSLIGRLIDSQQSLVQASPAKLRGRKEEDLDMEAAEVDFSDILSVDKEEAVYDRVKRFLSQQGKIVELNAVIRQVELDRSLKAFLDEQDTQIPGWKEALITDAINEAAQELGFQVNM